MTSFKMMLLAAAIVAPVFGATALQAQTVAVADPQAAVAGSTAFTTARTQIEATYKTQLDQAQARSTAIQGELQPLVTKLQNDQKANVAQATLQSEYASIQQRQQAGQQEIARITEPAQRAQAYAVEQIQARLGEAVQNVIKARNISMIVSPQAVLVAQPAADVTSAVTAELNRLVPSVGTTPPAGWQPGQQGAAAPAAGARPAAAPAGNSRRNGGR